MKTPIKSIRKKLGLTRRQFAHEVGTSYGAISNYELGYREPARDIAFRIKNLACKKGLEISLEDIYKTFLKH